MQTLKLSNVKFSYELQSLLQFFYINQNKRIIFAADFNIFFSSKLEARGGNQSQKENPL